MGLGDHPKTYLLKALCCESTPSWLKVVGWSSRVCWCEQSGMLVASEIILSSPGTGGTPYSHFPLPKSHVPCPKSRVPSPSPKSQSQVSVPSRLTITCGVEKTPYFYLYFPFLSPKEHFNENPTFLGETLQNHKKGP